MRETPFTEDELNEMNKSREGLREYFHTVAIKHFQRANEMPPGREKVLHLNTAMILLQNLDAFVESTYATNKKWNKD